MYVFYIYYIVQLYILDAVNDIACLAVFQSPLYLHLENTLK